MSKREQFEDGSQKKPAPEDNIDQQSSARTREQVIAESAYLRWLARGGNHGSDVVDWLEAEREYGQEPKSPTGAQKRTS